MIIKCFEVRDRATFVPVLAVQMVSAVTYHERGEPHYRPKPAQDYLLGRCGYPTAPPYLVLLTRLDGSGEATADPYRWGNRTFTVAHDHITKNFDALADGAVVDVEFILGETAAPKRSEREEHSL